MKVCAWRGSFAPTIVRIHQRAPRRFRFPYTLTLFSFRSSASDSTCDLRFTYCACAVSTLLGDWSGVNKRKAAEYIERCYVREHVCGERLVGFEVNRRIDSLHTLELNDAVRLRRLVSLPVCIGGGGGRLHRCPREQCLELSAPTDCVVGELRVCMCAS